MEANDVLFEAVTVCMLAELITRDCAANRRPNYARVIRDLRSIFGVEKA